MSRYSSSKFRIALLVLLLGAVVVTVSTSFAQPAPAGNTPAPTQAPAGLITLIMGHIDVVFITIAVLSIAGLTLIIQGFMKNRRSVFLPEVSINQMREMISQKRYKELLDYTETDPTFVSRAVNAALKRAPNFSSMKEAMETTVGEQTAEQFRKIEYLNIIGNLGPLLGLLGTVLGMIEAFSAMQAAGAAGASPAQLAGGISTALTHTFLGLMLAIPCLAAFGILRTLVDRLTTQAALIAEELLLMMKPSEAKAGASIASRPVAAPQPTGPGRKLPTPVPTPSGLGAQLER
jgi:biopolymer transport protein ExbB